MTSATVRLIQVSSTRQKEILRNALLVDRYYDKNFRNFRLGQINHVILQSHYIWEDRGIGRGLLENRISWFSYDVTKIQSKKLSILLRFYVV